MPVRSLATFVAVALAALIAPPNCFGESPAASIETSRLARHVEVLASDAFEGRGAGGTRRKGGGAVHRWRAAVARFGARGRAGRFRSALWGRDDECPGIRSGR